MSRTTVMTIGFLLIFLGIELNLVQSFELTPSAASFWNENIVHPASELVSETTGQTQAGWNSPWQQASWNGQVSGQRLVPTAIQSAGQRTLAHPPWICWPVFFAGTVFFLHGLSMRP